MSNELAHKQSGAIASMNPETLIMKAVESNVSVETLERLLAMRQSLKEEQAREAYFSALAAFQAECPTIKKTREVKDKNGRVRYSFAPLDDIVRQVGPLLKKHGFSYTIKTENTPEGIAATCEAHHEAGHTESSSFAVPIEKDAFMNDAQKAGSAQTYAKRYAFSNVFGLMTSDMDDDAQATGSGVSIQDIYKRATDHMSAVLDNIDTVMTVKDAISRKDYSTAAEAWFELSKDEMQALWLAPSKGGCFTTIERETMKSSAFREANGKAD